MDDPDITDDAIVLALKKFGSLRDLPEEFRQVVWVTVYQAREIAVKIELAGGSWGIAKSALRRDGDGDGLKFEQSLIRIVPV